MKTLAIQNEIVKNYKNISNIVKKPFDKKTGTAYLWSLKNKVNNEKTGFVSQLGIISIETNKKEKTGSLFKDFAIKIYNNIAKNFDSEIQILDGDIKKIKKPLFSTWAETLDGFNAMLKNTTDNINNKNLIKRNQLALLCFTKETSKRLQEINTKINR